MAGKREMKTLRGRGIVERSEVVGYSARCGAEDVHYTER
jgi:hypothetical protein